MQLLTPIKFQALPTNLTQKDIEAEIANNNKEHELELYYMYLTDSHRFDDKGKEVKSCSDEEIKQNKEKAVKWFESNADKNPRAQLILGFIYYNGEIVTQDLEKAKENLRAAQKKLIQDFALYSDIQDFTLYSDIGVLIGSMDDSIQDDTPIKECIVDKLLQKLFKKN